MKKMSSLEALFIEEMKDIYNAEKQLLKALPKMARQSSTPELRSAFESHLTQTENHVARLENAFELMGSKAKGTKCKAMEGLVEEAEDLMDMESDADPAVMDAALIAAAQKVEH